MKNKGFILFLWSRAVNDSAGKLYLTTEDETMKRSLFDGKSYIFM